ncbi:MAG: hypothetical protein O2967_00750 [Proteobacteria bacterium]|nr:hypothetical protein [Pseudomonadota bacterium]
MLSLSKILLFLAVAALVIVVSKTLRGRATKSGEASADATKIEALDLSQCAVCGNFVAVDTPGCERADCPYSV